MNIGRCPTGFTFYRTCFFLCGHCSDSCESPSRLALLNRYDNKLFIASRRKHRKSLGIHDLASALHSETAEEEKLTRKNSGLFLLAIEPRGTSVLHPGCALLNSPNKAFTQDQVQDLAAHPAPALLLGLLAVLSTATMRAIRKCSLFAVFRVPHISLV